MITYPLLLLKKFIFCLILRMLIFGPPKDCALIYSGTSVCKNRKSTYHYNVVAFLLLVLESALRKNPSISFICLEKNIKL